MIEAADEMVKAANVQFMGQQKVDVGLVTATIRGATLSGEKRPRTAGAAAARRVGELVGGDRHPSTPPKASRISS